MLCTVDLVLATAKNEVGYLEKKSNSNLDSKTANAGYGNFVKYWRDLYPKFQGQAWCDAYQKWIFIKSYGKEKANEMLCGGINSYYTPSSANFFAKKGLLDKNPKVGDEIYFSKQGAISSIYHVGLVTGFDSTWIYTNEGNTSSVGGVIPNGGGVFEKKYLFAQYQPKVFFGHPKYDIKTNPAATPVSRPLNKIPTYIGAIETKDKTSKVAVRRWAGTEYDQIKSWPYLANGNTVDVCDAIYAKDGSPWYYVRIAGSIYGFVRADFVKRLN